LRRAQALTLLLAIRIALPGVRFFPYALHLPQEQAHAQLGWLWRFIGQSGHLLLSLLDCRCQPLECPRSGQFPPLDRRAKGKLHLIFSPLLCRLADSLPLLHQSCDFVQPHRGQLGAQFGLGQRIRSQCQANLFGEELQVVQGLSRQTVGHSRSSAKHQSEKQDGHGQCGCQFHRSHRLHPSPS
jgi:hypothetical protein